ncbi:MAG TPA: pseudouridine synthase [Pseudomonadales bacterium]|nr:pseudouridine synthase [Pseudomonadales bacterium]
MGCQSWLARDAEFLAKGRTQGADGAEGILGHVRILPEIPSVASKKSVDVADVIPQLRDGVSASRVQVTPGVWPSALAFLCVQFPAVGEVVWLSRFARGLVLDTHGKVMTADSACVNGERIYYYRELEHEIEIPFYETILYQDEHILVADKPHFLPVIPSGKYVQQTLLVRLKKTTGIAGLSPVHRIDKDTAGLVLFSVNPATRDAYQSLFRHHAVKKIYHAIAPLLENRQLPLRYCSRLVEDEQFFRTREVTGEENSETHIELIQKLDGLGLYRLQPVTGRKHQLRVHLFNLGIPICNDPLYPEAKTLVEQDFSKPLQLLAKSLFFTDPLTKEKRYFESHRNLGL